MGESDSTVSQPPKPVCDWSLGPAGGEVKAHFPEFFSTVQTLPVKPFTRIPVLPQAVENLLEPVPKHAPKRGNSLRKLRDRARSGSARLVHRWSPNHPMPAGRKIDYSRPTVVALARQTATGKLE